MAGSRAGLPAYLFRRLSADDLTLLRAWRRRPHVIAWWGPPDIEDPEEILRDPNVAAWIVEHEGRAIAYAQDYDPHAWDSHPFSHLPAGARGIDQFIGDPELLGQGHGSAFVRAHVDKLFAAGAPAVGTDPHPDNARAIRAYEKAGFVRSSDPLDTRWGRAILMECWSR